MKKLQISDRKTLLMGILNLTPDSFSDGGEYFQNIEKAVGRTKGMIDEGADIIDIGGESTRPGSERVGEQEELKRVIPVIKAIRKKLGTEIFLSIDTYKAEVAREALKAGVNIVNSLGGFTLDKELGAVAAAFGCPVILYHIKGEPRTMQKGEIVYKDVVGEIMDFFDKQIGLGLEKGMKREQFFIDPGIGFGKTVEQNVEIIKRLGEFKKLDLPIVVGISRKSHLGKLLERELHLKETPGTSERLEAGLAETAVAVLNGARIVRTHDVKQTKRFLSILDLFKSNLTKIFIKDLEIQCNIGVTKKERQEKQPVLINIVMFANTGKAGQTDDIAQTINYEDVYLQVIEFVKQGSFNLLERLAGEIAEVCLRQEKVERVEVRVEKPRALKFAAGAGVEIIREKK